MTEIEQLREENAALYEALEIIAKNLTNDDGIDPEAWHLELTADEAEKIREVVTKNKAIPFPGQSPENRCKHGVLAGHCPDCPSIEEIEATFFVGNTDVSQEEGTKKAAEIIQPLLDENTKLRNQIVETESEIKSITRRINHVSESLGK